MTRRVRKDVRTDVRTDVPKDVRIDVVKDVLDRADSSFNNRRAARSLCGLGHSGRYEKNRHTTHGNDLR